MVFKGNPGRKLTRHDKSKCHKDAINNLTNLKIKDAFEKSTDQQTEKNRRTNKQRKIDGPTNREKNKANELYVEKLIRIVHVLARQQFTCQKVKIPKRKFLSDESMSP